MAKVDLCIKANCHKTLVSTTFDILQKRLPKMKLCMIVVCLVAVTYAKKPKLGKTEKKVDKLCSAYDAGYATVSDPTFGDIFSQDMLGDFCDDFFEALNATAKPVSRQVDGIKSLSKACKSYRKEYTEEPIEGSLVGFGAVCNASDEAAARTLNDRKSKKSLDGLTDICEAQDDGNLNIKISNFTEVFEDMEEFCEVFMEGTGVVVIMRRDAVDGVKVLDGVCRWYCKKFQVFAAEDSLALLDPICEDFKAIQMALEQDE